MGAVNHLTAAASEVSHPAWETLDDALQILVRAESLVMLLRCAFDVEEHHRYGAEIACDELRSLKQKLSEALGQIRPARRSRPAPRPAGRAGVSVKPGPVEDVAVASSGM